VRPVALFVVLAVLAACHGAEAPSTPLGQQGDTCKVGERVERQCQNPLVCTLQPYTAPANPPGVHGPDLPSDEGGACGGVAGFHCAEGLACSMAPDQVLVADAMGSCARVSKCVTGAK